MGKRESRSVQEARIEKTGIRLQVQAGLTCERE